VPRASADFMAVLSTQAGHCQVSLIDISRTGARLAGATLPPAGEQLTFRADNVLAQADVVWSELGMCAVEFDTPIAVAEVQRLQSLACPQTAPAGASVTKSHRRRRGPPATGSDPVLTGTA
jgi:hypothetical protein